MSLEVGTTRSREIGGASAAYHALEASTRSRTAAAVGFALSVIALLSGVVLWRSYRFNAAVAFAASALYLSAGLVARRTRRYQAPSAMIGFTFATATAVTVAMSTTSSVFSPNSLLWIALMPQLTTYVMGTRAGLVTGAGALVYVSAGFGILLAGRAGDAHLISSYLCGDVAIIVCLSLSILGTRVRERMVAELRDTHATTDALRLAERRRLDEELELAARVQMALLPRDPCVEGLALSASMLPAAEVGGDYYDVLPFEGGAWLSIGRVAGRGLDAGLAMLMIQSAVGVLAQADPAHDPDRALHALHATLHQNIRQRLKRDEHATLTLLHYQRDGSVHVAGAPEQLLLFRAAARRCEAPWREATPDVAPVATASRLTLGDGDLIVLYTDGLAEARDRARQRFGRQRIEAEILRTEGQPVDAIRQAILDAVRAFGAPLVDDVTLLVARYRAPEVLGGLPPS